VVQQLIPSSDPDLLVGPEHFSDAGVYQLAPGLAIVQTVDFFPPLVEDPYTFGRIAAANSLSDIYAMGARPRTALNIVGFPDKELPLSILSEILRGGGERIAAAGAVILGGHSVRDVEIKYGLSVTGTVDPAKMMTNDAAKPGDVLVLTKPLGTGFITTANRAEKCPPAVMEAACASMVMLNDKASEAALALGSRAATDITGFGLAGHAREMADASNVTLRIELDRLPLLPGALELSREGFLTGANKATERYIGERIRFEPAALKESDRAKFLFDPQTSGGLLIAIARERAEELVRQCIRGGADSAAIVGLVRERGAASIIVV
jgi:selenide,water dikinase